MDEGTDKCSKPVWLRRREVEVASGVVSDKYIEKACGSRIQDACPHCAAIYKRDALTVINSGLRDGSGKTVPLTFITLTAPGSEVFGHLHQRVLVRRRDGREVVRRCPCGQYHDQPDDARIGTPVDPGTYRYDLAADFNSKATRLLAVTMQKLSRHLGRPVQRVRVAEFQNRGLVHFHLLVRGVVTPETIRTVVSGGVNKSGRKVRAASHAGWSWGEQCDAKPILPGSKVGVGAYLNKVVGYAVKSTDASSAPGGSHGDRMAGAGEQTVSPCGKPHCRHGFARPTVHQPKWRCRSHSLARRGWGFRGHVLSVSRKWGLTFGEVRARRQNHVARLNPAAETTTVEWLVLGRHFQPPVSLS